jgi:hypothetical protein
MDQLCNHKLHDNIVVSYSYGNKNIMTVMNKWFISYKDVLFIVDSEKLLKSCPTCGTAFYLYIYGQSPNFCASFDGVTDLPIKTYNYIIDEFIIMTPFSEPSFGTFLYSALLSKGKTICGHFILYCLVGKLAAHGPHASLDDKMIVCCTSDSGLVFIDEDGKIILPEIGCADGVDLPITFKIGNCHLICESRSLIHLNNGKASWTYKNLALNTKPAATAIVE